MNDELCKGDIYMVEEAYIDDDLNGITVYKLKNRKGESKLYQADRFLLI
jgi:CRISPR/Cas system CMR-associated protein Cmr3 (group 5 of RAMP superfamily)